MCTTVSSLPLIYTKRKKIIFIKFINYLLFSYSILYFSSVKESLLGNTNSESATSVHLIKSNNKQANGSSTTGHSQAQYRDTAAVLTGSAKSRYLEDIDNLTTSNNSETSKRKQKAIQQLNRSYSTACTSSTSSGGFHSSTQTTKEQNSSKRKKKRAFTTNLKLSLSGGRLSLASPSNLSDLILGSEEKALLNDQDTSLQHHPQQQIDSHHSRQQNEQSTNLDQLTNSNLSAKSLSQKRKLYGRSTTNYSQYRYSPNRSLSVEDVEDQELAQSLIDKPTFFDDDLIGSKADQSNRSDKYHRIRTSSSGSHQLATNFNNRKARHRQPFSRQLSELNTGSLLTTTSCNFTYGKQRSPTSQQTNQFANTFQARTIHSSSTKQQQQQSSSRRPFLSQSTIDTSRLIDNENLIIDDFITPEAISNLQKQQQDSDNISNTSRLASISKKSTLQSGDSSESANQARIKQHQKSSADELLDYNLELRNMNAKSSKLIAATSLGSQGGGGGAVGGIESRTTSITGSNSPITRPTTFTLNMPSQTSLPGSPKESTNLMRQFSDRDEISLYGTPKEEMPHGGFHGDSRTANFMRNQIASLFQPSDNKLAMKLFGSKKALMKERERQKESGLWVIHPCSTFRFYWDLCMLLLLVANLIVLPVAISFFNDDLSMRWIAFNCLSDTIFLLDIFVNFRTGIMNPDLPEQVILDPKEISRHYLRTWFFLDLLSSIPLDYIFLIFSDRDLDNDNFQLLQAGRALRIFRYVCDHEIDL